MALEHPQTDYATSYYDDDSVQVNDVLKLGNILWLATSNGVTKINQTTRKRVEYTEAHLPDKNVESIAASKADVIWIGTYGRGMAVQDDDDKWIPVKYIKELFGENTIEKDGKILIEGDEDRWLRTNFIHIDPDDTLWIGTSAGVLQLQYKSGEEPIWKGPFNPEGDKALNVLFIQDIERGIEIIGNFGEQGYPYNNEEESTQDYYGTDESPGVKTYRLYNTIPTQNGSWQPLEEDTP